MHWVRRQVDFIWPKFRISQAMKDKINLVKQSKVGGGQTVLRCRIGKPKVTELEDAEGGQRKEAMEKTKG